MKQHFWSFSMTIHPMSQEQCKATVMLVDASYHVVLYDNKTKQICVE